MGKTQPTAEEQRWRENVRALGSVISGCPAVIHHPVGRTARHNKVDIGHWWVIPLTDYEHKALHDGHLDWLLCETRWEDMGRKEFEKAAFLKVWEQLCFANDPHPADVVPIGVFSSIMDYHR